MCIIDFTESSNSAIGWAILMCQQLRAHLCILHTYRLLPSKTGELTNWKKNREEEAQQKFNILEKQHLIGKGLSYEFKMEIGFVADRLEEYAKYNNLDFIIMDNKTDFSGYETFHALFNHLPAPILLIP